MFKCLPLMLKYASSGGSEDLLLHQWQALERYVQVLATDVKVNLLNHRNWRLGPELLYRFSWEDVDDSVVDKMEEIDGAFDLGLFGG